MKTGTILTFGGAVVLAIGAMLGLVFVPPLVLGRGSLFSNLLAVAILSAAPIACGLLLLGAGRRRARLESEHDERGFAELATSLAQKSGGAVKLDPLCKAAGLTAAEAQAKMRALAGRGLFDLDFDEGGQMVFKLSPNAGQAQLAQLSAAARALTEGSYDRRVEVAGGGAGLGLSIAHTIVKAHHGRLAVESPPGGGASFTVVLPAAAAAAHLS
ncbi:MAG: hypothetical protein NVS4B10_20860 [Myxococcales bacterium]